MKFLVKISIISFSFANKIDKMSIRVGFKCVVLFLFSLQMFSQDNSSIKREGGGRNSFEDSVTRRKKNLRDKLKRPAIDLYKIISVENDTTVVDTSLTVEKLYKYNYLRKDNFELLSFSNEGQTYNTLAYDFSTQNIRPLFGARARHFNYMEVADINYYQVPTPFTELYYKSVFSQGQNLDAFFTMNKSKRFNFSIAYKGLRSLGKYQNFLTSTGNFRFTLNYQTKNKRYDLKAHYVAQDLMNQQNGGLTDQALLNFASGNSQFNDRARLSVNFEDAENILDGARFYLNQRYDLIPQNDSISKNRIQVGHILNYEDKFYRYEQASPATALFGNSFVTSNLVDRTDLEELNNRVFVEYSNDILGTLNFQANHTYYNYGYNSVLIQEEGRIPNGIQGDLIAVGAAYKKMYRGFQLKGEAQTNVVGDFSGLDFKAEASYELKDKANFSGGIHINSAPANYNHLLYQSSYENYNWFNAEAYDNVKTSSLYFNMRSNNWLNASAELVNIADYAYFAKNDLGLTQSFQAGGNVTYLKLKLNKEFRFGKFALDNTVAYQNVSSGMSYLNVPEVITRNTLYYKDQWFQKALFVQTGFRFNYFTEYNMNGYDPVLAEFYVQNDQQLGGFPLLDLFFNMKVRQTRIFFIAEHINSLVSPSDYYSAPGYPYRDFTFRFGLVWNFFL